MSCIFLAEGQATTTIEEETAAVEAIKIASIDINTIVINVGRGKEIINIGTNATAVAQTNNLLKVLVLLTLPGVKNALAATWSFRDLTAALLASKRECAIF